MKIFKKIFNVDEAWEVIDDSEKTIPGDRTVSFSYKDLREIPESFTRDISSWVEFLDLSYNKLRDLSFLKPMKNLHTLILDHNLIVSTSHLPKLESLRVLWLNYNLISNIELFLPALSRACVNLEVLSLMGNMAAPSFINGGSREDHEAYRHYVIRHFCRLRYLDDMPVCNVERLRASTSFQNQTLDSLWKRLQEKYEATIARPNSIV